MDDAQNHGGMYNIECCMSTTGVGLTDAFGVAQKLLKGVILSTF